MRDLIKKFEEAGHKFEGTDEALMESERVQRANIAKTADAMVSNPMAARYLAKIGMAGYEMQLQQSIEAILIQVLQSKGVGVSGGSQAVRTIRDMGRGRMPI